MHETDEDRTRDIFSLEEAQVADKRRKAWAQRWIEQLDDRMALRAQRIDAVSRRWRA